MQTRSQTLDAAARWLAIGMVLTPIVDIADRTGVLTAPAQLEGSDWLRVVAQVLPLVLLGGAAAWLMRRHDPRDRTWFFGACAAVVLGYVLVTGLRIAVVAGLVALAFAFVQLRLVAPEAANPPAG
jgi:hypothetical protein